MPCPSSEKPHVPEPVEEIEVWWGSYSGWNMLPSWAICCILTVLIAWGGATLEFGRFWRVLVFVLAATLWLLQLARWGYRVLSYNYRLTNRRLFRDTGFFHDDRIRIDLSLISKVDTSVKPYEAWFDTGRVLISTDEGLPPIPLKGVRNPRAVAELIRACVKQAELSSR